MVQALSLFYDVPAGQTYKADGVTNDFTSSNLMGICFCDITIGACDPNCDCDAECTQNHDALRTTYGFDYSGNTVSIQTDCYHKVNDHLYSVSGNKLGLKKTTDNDTFVCVEVTDTTIEGNYITPVYTVDSKYQLVDSPNTLTATQNDTSPTLTAGYQMSDSVYMENALSKFVLPEFVFSKDCFTSSKSDYSMYIPYFGIQTIISCDITLTSLSTQCTQAYFESMLNVKSAKTFSVW